MNKIISTLTLVVILSGCTYPNSKLASVSINATMIDNSGKPIPNKKLEITLPASYGMKDLDLELNTPEELGKNEQKIIVKTDPTGNFNYTFEPVSYNTAYWFLPPLGNYPKRPPRPSFVIKLLENQNLDANIVYSIGWNEENKLNYSVLRSASKRSNIPPYYLTGRLHRNNRGEIPACIADFKFKKSN